MITNSMQQWAVGSIVKCGFMQMIVVAVVTTPGDYAPDFYILSSASAFYRFTPHKGIRRISAEEAKCDVSTAQCRMTQETQRLIANAGAQAEHLALVSQLIRS